ncbi:G/U mismatch-specific uracil DNA glycosylase [Colletotrichum shisoi]|uniref:G/U mismatch-specific uracil DNA glycosylase n=1 Tax=Colletotrichum shisoi TaxID=2078593 RepID=A0A5Q4C5V3_9PEZI|nr:G/U mismatch-specific uracil DNA glycosylase [Colletotrichum shisoi]
MESPFFGQEPQPKAASFQGRLQLQEYMFSPTAPPPPGGGLPVLPAIPSHRPPSSPAPLRRSSRKSTPLGPVPSPNRVTRHRTAAGSNCARHARVSTPEPLASSSASAPIILTPKPEPLDWDSDGLALVPYSSTVTPAAQTPGARPKRKRKATGYAPPSTYAHLPPLTDILAPGLLVLFVGLNPGLRTAALGHAYAHPSNLFWKLLHSSGITPRLCSPTEDRKLPHLYGLGNTNIVSRPSRNGAELSKAEMDEGVDVLEDKIRGCRPEVVCIVGKGIWESIWRVRHGRGIRKEEFRYGWQDKGESMGVAVKREEEEGGGEAPNEAWAGAKVFVATSTSGLAATLRPAEKERIWRELGEWCEMRRAQKSTRGR